MCIRDRSKWSPNDSKNQPKSSPKPPLSRTQNSRNSSLGPMGYALELQKSIICPLGPLGTHWVRWTKGAEGVCPTVGGRNGVKLPKVHGSPELPGAPWGSPKGSPGLPRAPRGYPGLPGAPCGGFLGLPRAPWDSLGLPRVPWGSPVLRKAPPRAPGDPSAVGY